jgi:hypothetical protein
VREPHDGGDQEEAGRRRRTQQRFIDWVTQRLTKAERRRLHDEITGQHYSESEIIQIIEAMFGPSKLP